MLRGNKLRGRATCCGQQVACCPQHVACISLDGNKQHVAGNKQHVTCCAQHVPRNTLRWCKRGLKALKGCGIPNYNACHVVNTYVPAADLIYMTSSYKPVCNNLIATVLPYNSVATIQFTTTTSTSTINIKQQQRTTTTRLLPPPPPLTL